MHNKTIYRGCTRREGRMMLQTSRVLVLMMGIPAVTHAAPSTRTSAVTITERTATTAAVRNTAKAPKRLADVRTSAPILQTATRRLTQVAGREASVETTVKVTVDVKSPTGGSTTTDKKSAGAKASTGSKAVTAAPVKAMAAAKEKAAKPASVRAAAKTAQPAVKAAHCAACPGGAATGFRPATPTGSSALQTKASPDSQIQTLESAPRPAWKAARKLKVGESQVLEFQWVYKIAVGNKDVADVVALSDNQVLVNGKATGETNLFVWDKGGQHEYRVAVIQATQDLEEVARRVAQELGRQDIQVRAIGDTLFLFGRVASQPEQQQAEAVAAAHTKNVKNFIQLVQDGEPERPAAVEVASALGQIFGDGAIRARALDDGTTVVLEGSVNGEKADQARRVAQAMAKGVTVIDYFQPAAAGQRQVLVRSRVVDIDRVKTKELGIDWGPVLLDAGPGGTLRRIVGEQPFLFGEAQTGPIGLDQGGPLRRFDPIGFKLRALQQQNAARVLSEPNLLVMEGSKGGILIGGEIPIPVAQQSGAGVGTSITVEYKPFGIRLDVEVMNITDEGVNLRVSPEVSALDYTNSVRVNGFNLPALRTRRADTTVFIRRGQTLAIGGLLANDINRQVKAIPLLSKVPILGELFKDRRFQRGESELVILVTPEVPGPDNTVSTPIPNVELKRPDPNVKDK
jgi:pilus assembly protein CpaC